MLAPGVAISSGSLGHGLPIAVGAALTGRSVYCLVGDGELDEGSNWEAVQWAGRIGLAALTAIVVDNHSATYRLARRDRASASSWRAGRARTSTAATTTHSNAPSAPRTAAAPHVVVAEVRR